MNFLCNRPNTLHTNKGRERVAFMVIMKALVSAAIAVGCCVGGAPLASADAIDFDPNPFGALTCNCQQTASPGGPALSKEMEWGIRAGLSASPDNRSLN